MTGWPGEALDAADELLVCKTVARGHLERAAERAAERDALAAFAQGLQVATDSLRAERDALAAKVERVRALHRREVIAVHEFGPEAWCPTCELHYPCPTIRALDEEAQPL